MSLLPPRYAWEVPCSLNKKPILRGEQTAGICLGHRDYLEGQRLMIGCSESEAWVAVADIVMVRHRFLKDLTRSEWFAAGFVAQDEVLQFFGELYPEKTVTLESEVTVLRWQEIRGACVDEIRKDDAAKPE